ncbi:MAG: hypothetical protein KGY75_09525 [Candidatus Cloacimonetes bacterium]|nr:hypothetical protein [Candidatus Cloacimonadota bacterium]
MNYLEFKRKMEKFHVFSIREIDKQFDDFDSRRLVEWQKRGYILKLRNSYYCFADNKDENGIRFYAGTVIYNPSYISLESALSWYGFIPEAVFQTTLSTTLKTNKFETPIGNFSYRHLKSDLFFGYKLNDFKNHHYPFAYPEKAILDYLYLHPEIAQTLDLKQLRWNDTVMRETIDIDRLNNYEARAKNKLLSERIKILKEFIDVRNK